MPIEDRPSPQARRWHGRWGSALELADDGGSGMLRDRTGEVVVRMERGGADEAGAPGSRIWLRGAPGRELTVSPPAAAELPHPILGTCSRLLSDDAMCSLMSEVRWSAPSSIPPIAEPARLPPLTGTMLLNWLAHCAAAAGVPALHYVGPYPTAALYASLCQSFTPSDAEAAFTAEAAALLLSPRMQRSPVAFTPAPFERWWPTARVGVQARDQIERVFVDGAAFELSSTSVRRLVAWPGSGRADLGGVSAELWFGDTRWALVAELSQQGDLLRGPLPLPAIDDPIVGQELPLPLRRALASLIVDAVPAPLAPLVEPILTSAILRWGDAGTAALAPTPDGATLHAALWLTLRPHGPARLALALAETLTPWVTSRAVRSPSARSISAPG